MSRAFFVGPEADNCHMAKKAFVLIINPGFTIFRYWETNVPSQLILVRLTLSLLWMTMMFSHHTCWGLMMVGHESQSTQPLDTSIGMVWDHWPGEPVSIVRFKSKPVTIVFTQSPVCPFIAYNILMREVFFHSFFFLIKRQKQHCAVINVLIGKADITKACLL